jgi:cell division protein FtsW
VRIAKRSTDPFARLAASGVTAWLAAQSLINIGAVVGLVPITGIPLPLVSFGGSALIPTMVAIGMLLSFARAEPGAQQALAHRSLISRFRKNPPKAPAPRRTATARTTPRGTGRAPSRRPAARGR